MYEARVKLIKGNEVYVKTVKFCSMLNLSLKLKDLKGITHSDSVYVVWTSFPEKPQTINEYIL